MLEILIRETQSGFPSAIISEPLHLYFGGRGNLALEYQLPAASSWADVVLFGGPNRDLPQ